MAIEVEKMTCVTISAEEFLSRLDDYETCEVICAVAEKYDSDFIKRHEATSKFAAHLSENGCRFLAEVITNHYVRRG